jgi:hypothetical protein
MVPGRLSRQCWFLNVSQTYRPPRPDTGIALPFTFNVNIKAPRFVALSEQPLVLEHCVSEHKNTGQKLSLLSVGI